MIKLFSAILILLFLPSLPAPYFGGMGGQGLPVSELMGDLQTSTSLLPALQIEENGNSSGGLYNMIRYDDVVVVYNVNSEVSRAIMENFTRRRGIPSDRVIGVDVPVRETIDRNTFNTLRTQVEGALKERNLTERIDYIVTTKGVPLRVWGPGSSGSASVDAELALILGPYSGYIGGSYWIQNPYYGKNERFSRVKYGFYLVTRITGYNLSDALSLIERAERSGGMRGTFLLDVDPGKGGGYAVGNRWLRDANTTLRSLGFKTHLDETTTFITDFENCSGYASWGSNDGHYSTIWNTNPGFEGGFASWEFSGEGEALLNTSYPYRGGRCLEVKKNTTAPFFIAQNVSVRGSVAYYLSGHVNMTGGEVHFTAEVFTSSGTLLLREEGGVVRGPTSSWELLRQLPLKPLPPTAAKLRIIINVSGEGEFYFDEIRLLEVKPHNSWVPGAIAETYVSTSGRTFTWPPYYGQSLI
ncbi:MAG: TIGR03790 family protein, partial [Thermoplasmata archaeon]|nr:TIGR03790 family protein [Thermoplasmata archaeon]